MLSWHLRRFYTATPSRQNDRIYNDDEDASLDDVLQSRIDLSSLEPGMIHTLQDLLTPQTLSSFLHSLHGPELPGNPPLCFWWGDVRANPESTAKRKRQDKGQILTLTLPLSLTWPLMQNAVSMEPGRQPVWKLDVLTHQGTNALRQESGCDSDVLHMKVFDIHSGANTLHVRSVTELFKPLHWALQRWHARQEPHWVARCTKVPA